MSLLLQALQKAAKSREDGEGEPRSGSVSADQLTLEPIQTGPARRPDAAPPPPTPAQAAKVVQASRAPAFDPIDYAREHYMIVFIASAFLFAAGYGTYVYIQVANPGMFRTPPKPAPAPVAAASPAAPEAPQTATAKISGMPAMVAGTDTSTATPAVTTPASVFDEPAVFIAEKTAQPAAKPARAATPRPRRKPVEPEPLTDASDSVETVVIQSAQPSSEIAVRRDPATVTPVDPALMQAYEALQSGDAARARLLYAEVLRAEPRSIDALLGLGAIAWKEARPDEASRHYQRVLELDPRNSYAQAGLIAIIGGADPQASETRLRQLIARDPTAFLYFTLGNLYADQGQWSGAQQAYFQAYQLQPDNPDYAFNLAVGLEHLGQDRLALDYYRKALDLSFKKGRANFDQNLAIQRVGLLSTRVEQ